MATGRSLSIAAVPGANRSRVLTSPVNPNTLTLTSNNLLVAEVIYNLILNP